MAGETRARDGMTCPRCSGALREGDSEWLCECGDCGRQWPPPANLVSALAASAEREWELCSALEACLDGGVFKHPQIVTNGRSALARARGEETP